MREVAETGSRGGREDERRKKDAPLMDLARDSREGYIREEQHIVGTRDSRERSQEHMISTERTSTSQDVVSARKIDNGSAFDVKRSSEVDRRAVGSTETWRSSSKIKEISEFHDSDFKRTSDSRRHFGETRLKSKVDTSTSVQNSVHVERDKRTETEQQAVHNRESTWQHVKNLTNVSWIRESDTKKTSSSQSLIEAKRNDRDYHSTSDVNLVLGTMEQQHYGSTSASAINTKSSVLSRSEIERVSYTQNISTACLEQENHPTSAVNLVYGTREQQNQNDRRVDRQYSSRRASERDTTSSEFLRSEVERVSNTQGISTMRTGNQKVDSSLVLVRSKKDRQSSTLIGESSQSEHGISDGKSSSLYTHIHEVGDQASRGETHQFKHDANDALESATQHNKSSTMYYGEFVDKLRQEISTSKELDNASKRFSDIQAEEMHRESSQVTTDTQLGVLDATITYRDETCREEIDRQSSSRSGTKGPSDEMWDVRGQSSQGPVRTEEPEGNLTSMGVVDSTAAPKTTENSIARRSHRSLWTYIADIIRTGWGLRAESHSLTQKSGTRSSSSESISSEAWFSGHDLDENDHDTDKNGRSGTPKESLGTKRPIDPSHLRTHSLPTQGSSLALRLGDRVSISEASSSTKSITKIGSLSKGASPVSKQEDLRLAEIEKGRRDSPSVVTLDQSLLLAGTLSKGASPVSKQEYLQLAEIEKGRQGSPSAVTLDRSLLLVGSTVYRTPEEEKPDIENIQTPENFLKLEEKGEISMNKPHEVSRTEGKDGDLKQRKLQRNKQVLKERFDDWEEAYKLESEQRKVDEFFMREAILEAKKAADTWEVPVGAVLVKNGKIIARGCNLVEELRDSTAHAEMTCIREASSLLRTWRLAETTLYVTLEPCPMCAGAILQARIDTVVWGTPNKLLGADGSWVRLFPGWDGASRDLELSNQMPGPVHPFHPKITIRRGILATECADEMQQFFHLRRKQKKQEPSPPSCLPITSHPTKLFSKMHNIFSMMFCL